MAYGQKNYLALQGRNNPANGFAPKYRIDQIGCLLTSFCNVLSKYFGVEVDPVTLNNFYRDRGVYIDVDDGILDDLFWEAVTAFAPQVTVRSTGDAGWPDISAAIVCFHYRSVKNPTLPDGRPNMIDHFCAVEDPATQTIIDSYDGVVKTPGAYQGIYGEPIKWATFSVPAPVSVAPPAPAAPRYQVVETYPEGKQIRLNKQPTNLWGMNYSFEYMKDHPVEVHEQGEEWTVVDKVRHEDGYDYYRRAGQVDGFNVLDCDDVTPDAAVGVTVTVNTPTPQAEVLAAETVAPSAPDLSWQKTAKNVADYRAKLNLPVRDLATGQLYSEVIAGQVIHAVERFTKDGVEYIRTQKAVDSGRFSDIPLDLKETLELVKAINIVEPDKDEIFKQLDLSNFADELDAKIKKVNTKGFRENVVKIVGQIMVFFTKKK